VWSCRGSPRADRAWPSAWPSPSGPLGWQRLRGQGPALAQQATRPKGAPLTLEGPAQTMRGVRPGAVTFHPATGAPGATTGPAQLTERIAHGALRRGCGLRPVRGIGAVGSGPRRCAIAQEEAGQAAPPPAARVPNIPCRYRHGTAPLVHAFRARPAHLRESRPGPVGLARRRCALEKHRRGSCNSGPSPSRGTRRTLAPSWVGRITTESTATSECQRSRPVQQESTATRPHNEGPAGPSRDKHHTGDLRETAETWKCPVSTDQLSPTRSQCMAATRAYR
jgi:hypothetical protein